MKTLIQQKIKEIEQEREIKVLYACESGSRAWGFESEDSDWDVRFVYIHPPAWYLTVTERRDVIEFPINDELDISGWELRKALGLFRKSNAPLLEWFDSPIVYMHDEMFLEELKNLIPIYFSEKSCAYHYLHMAENAMDGHMEAEQIKLKKYLYIFRAVLACVWLERVNKPIPTLFPVMVDTLIDDLALKAEIANLIKQKMAATESDYCERSALIDSFLLKNVESIKASAPTLQGAHSKVEPINDLFYRTLKRLYDDF